MPKNKDYKNFNFIDDKIKYGYGYAYCLLQASINIGVKNPKVYYHDDDPSYQGVEDLHLEGKYNGRKVYFYLRQSYGSCSYCDWLEGVGSGEVIAEYEKQLKNAFDL